MRFFDRTFFLLLLFSLASCVGLIFSTQKSAAQSVVKATYGGWRLRCEPIKAEPSASIKDERCVLTQDLVDNQSTIDGEKIFLRLLVIVLKAQKPNGDDQLLLRVVAPLGTLLPRGLGLRIDDQEIGSTGFVRCVGNGCVAEVEMDEKLIKTFRSGKQAIFVIFMAPDQGRGVPLQLKGFDEGLKHIK